MRLTVNVGAELHLVHPLGFELDDTRMLRAGLDYREHARVQHHETFAECVEELAGRRPVRTQEDARDGVRRQRSP